MGKPPPEAKKVRRALNLAGAEPPLQSEKVERSTDDLWPVGTLRVFVSHLAVRKYEVN
jgi:hypothetical protein